MSRHQPPRIAGLFSTSGHSGVDRIMKNLLPAIAERGYGIDLLHVRRHGPYLEGAHPDIRIIDLGTRHSQLALPAVVRYLRHHRPGALLSDKDKINRMALWARNLARVPTRLVFRMGTTVSEDLKGRSRWSRMVHRWSIHNLYPRADAVVMPSYGAADDLARFGNIDRHHITVVRNPLITPAMLELAREQPDHPWLQGERRVPVILGVGELGARKGFSTLIEAFARLRKERPCRLLILGRGRERERLLEQARTLGVEKDVDLPGFKENPFAYMRRADLFVLSSVYEGFGNVLVEAMALGTPVVSTDCPSGPGEVLEGGRHGPLVPVGDSEAMAGAMARVLDTPPDPEMLRRAVGDYTLDEVTSHYLRVLGYAPRPETE